MKLFFSIVFILTVLGQGQLYAQNKVSLQVPGKNETAMVNPNGISVLPSGRYVTPAGNVLRLTHDPFGMKLSPDGKKIVTLHNGVFSIIDLQKNSITRIPDYKGKIKSPFEKGSMLGVSFYKNSNIVFLSGGDKGDIISYDIDSLKIIDRYSLNGRIGAKNYNHSLTSDLIYNDAEEELIALDLANYRVVRIDLKTKKLKSTIPSGRLPFGLALSPDKKTVLVANVGMYAYPLIEGINDSNYNKMLIDRHPYAHNSKESINGTIIDGKKIPGVGDPNSPEAMSVFVIDLDSNKVSYKIKTGKLVGQWIEDAEVIGGSSPNSIVVGNHYAYVSNATNDNISVIDYKNGRVVKDIVITADKRIDKYRGFLPFGLSLDEENSRLYVALLGFNSLAVIDLKTDSTVGHIPTGWGPSRVIYSKENQKIYAVSGRGLGAGPNGGKGFKAPEQGTYVGDIQLATFQSIDIPNADQLKLYTQRVLDNTFVTSPIKNENNPLPTDFAEVDSPIKHIVYITKENRTYDEIFGYLKQANGDSTLARFGVDVDLYLRKDTILKARVTPNHKKIATKYSFSDNFYCDSDASIHGHHWMMGVIPNEWVETNSKTSKTAMLLSDAPGRRFPGSTGSMDPEDFAEKGGLWEALERKGVSFYNFGEANETAHVREEWMDTATGAGHGVMVPMQKALYSRTSHNYAGFNSNIPDQFRMDQFESEFTKMWLNGKDTMPGLITMQVPNDHTSGARPADGYLFPQSFVADNDLAIGRILHFLSRTPYWKNTLVIITEDDPQGGVDHVDAHRSILMMAGPYVKRGYVSHTHANFGSILKTIYNILGVSYVNQYDVTASLLKDFFTSVPDYSTYDLEKSDERIFKPETAMKKYNRGIDWRKVMKGPEMDDEDDMRKNHYKEQNSKSKKK